MNKLCALPVALALVVFASCQKTQTEEERNAEIDRRVEKRLAAEHQAQQQGKLEQQEADLNARENALAEEETADAEPQTHQTSRPSAPRLSEPPANGSTASYSTFYNKLEPYGVWHETNDYGFVWQPEAAQRSRDWRPYTNGRWVYTDVGWMWVSEEPFGWAAYHYGRWARLRHIGWVWVPGDEWAPAWVSWRKGDDYIGWAPLPPEAGFDRRAGIHTWSDNYYDVGPDQYCFVPTRQFGAQRVSPTIVSSESNVSIVNQTTNVTNITYSNTRVVNQGPDYYELQKRTQQPIERLRVERRLAMDAGEEDPRPVIRGEVIEMPAPAIAKPAPAERPRRFKEAVSQATVDRGWHAVPDSQAAEKARAKIKSESTPPPDAPPRTFVKPVRSSNERAAFTPGSASVPTAPPAEPLNATAQVPDARTSGSETRQGRRSAPTPTPSLDVPPLPIPNATPALTPTPLPTPIPKTEPMPSAKNSPAASATPPVQLRDQKEKKKEDKKEKKAEKKARGKSGEAASPTPGR